MRGVVVIAVGSDLALRLGGMALVTRAVCSLRRLGIEVTLVGPPEAGAIVWRERGLAVSCVGQLAEAVCGPTVVLRHDRVVSRGLVAAIASEEGPCSAVVGGRLSGLSRVDEASVSAWEAELPRVELEGWWAEAASEEALDRLLDDCRKPVDGFVARHLNRHLSLALTRRLVDATWLSPNAMTGVMAAVSLAGAAMARRGGYRATLAGAALMQLGSILDGVDGELARIRFEESALGAWLDTIADDVTNVAFWAALAEGTDEPRWRACGRIAAGANALAALVSYVALWRLGSGDFYALPEPERRGVARLVARLLKQDAFLALSLVAALAGRLHQALPLAAGGAVVTLGAAVRRHCPKRK